MWELATLQQPWGSLNPAQVCTLNLLPYMSFSNYENLSDGN